MAASPNNAELDRTACAVADAAHAAQASATADDIVCAANIAENPYKRDFPLLANHPDLVFLDSAATAQRPAVVLDAQRRFYEEMNANALRGLYRLSVEATEAIEIARQRVARFIGAPDAHDIVLTRNASESLNIVAKAFAPTVLEPGDEVCITIMEHHSNLIPWQQACRAAGAKLVYLYREDRPEDEDPVRRARVQRAWRAEPRRGAWPPRARAGRLPGGRRRAVHAAHPR